MTNRRFVIVDTKRGKLFAKNQPGNFTTEPVLASWWSNSRDAQKALKNRSALKSKAGQLKIVDAPFYDVQELANSLLGGMAFKKKLSLSSQLLRNIRWPRALKETTMQSARH